MIAHLLVESHGPMAGHGCARFIQDAAALAATGHKVQLVLIQDGVAAAVRGALPELDSFAEHGGEVWVDRYSVDQRGLPGDVFSDGVKPVDFDEVADRVLDPGTRVVWH